MNSGYIGRLNPYWNATSSDLQYSPLMQTIPTATSTIKSTSPPLFRPYNHYPLEISPQFHNIDIHKNKPHKSAFKPVIRNSNVLSTKSVQKPTVESSHYNLPNVILPNGNNCFGYGQAQFPIPYDPLIVNRGPKEISSPETITNVSNFNPMTNTTQQCIKSDKPNLVQNLHKPIAVCQNKNIHSPIENVRQWNPLLSLASESLKRDENILPQKKSYTRKRKREEMEEQQSCIAKQNEVLVIDLTSNEDECTTTSTPSAPLDINGNEILVTTNTKPMEMIACKKTKDLKYNNAAPHQKHIHLPLPMESTSAMSNAFLSTMPTHKSTNSPILFANLTQNGYRMPPKEQLKFINKYNRWMRYFRVYNGFRLFAQQNHAKARDHTNKNDDRVFIQNTLVKWWNALPPAAKEQYAHIAEIMQQQKLSASSQSSRNNATNVSTSSISMPPILDDFDTNTNEAIDVNVNQNKETSGVKATDFAHTTYSFSSAQL